MKWISVKQRLPEDGKKNNGKIICIAYGTDPARPFKEFEVIEAKYDKKLRIFEYGEYDTYIEVTHWMPLPEPPIYWEKDIHLQKC